MYLEGLGFRQIARILGVSNVSIFRWIKASEVPLDTQKMAQNSEEVEIDGFTCNA